MPSRYNHTITILKMRLKHKKKYYTTRGDEGGFYEDIKVGFEMEIKPVTLDIMVDMFNSV